MSEQTKSVLAAALALPEPDRAFLAERLLDSLPAEPDALSDEELERELDKRFEECERDPRVVVPWSEIQRQQ
jgi:putative addiction module component (TIGR02574 family)